jgi:hypothetical protein
MTDLKKLSVVELKQLSVDLARAIVDLNNALRQELTANDELKYENQLSRDFITLSLNIHRKRRQQQTSTAAAVADDDDLDVSTDCDSSGTVSEILVFYPNDHLKVMFVTKR